MHRNYSPVKHSTVPAPVITIGLGSPLATKSELKSFKALIDTGYDGSVLISLDTFRELGLLSFKLPADMTATAEFITGEKVSMKSAEGLIHLTRLDLEIIVNIDALPEINEVLIGRQILEELYLALKGPESKLVLAKTKETFQNIMSETDETVDD